MVPHQRLIGNYFFCSIVLRCNINIMFYFRYELVIRPVIPQNEQQGRKSPLNEDDIIRNADRMTMTPKILKSRREAFHKALFERTIDCHEVNFFLCLVRLFWLYCNRLNIIRCRSSWRHWSHHWKFLEVTWRGGIQILWWIMYLMWFLRSCHSRRIANVHRQPKMF